MEHWEPSLCTHPDSLRQLSYAGLALSPVCVILISWTQCFIRSGTLLWSGKALVIYPLSQAWHTSLDFSYLSYRSNPPSPCTQRTYQAVSYTRNLRRLLFHISQLEISKNTFLQPKHQAPNFKELPIKQFNSQMSLSLYKNMPVVS